MIPPEGVGVEIALEVFGADPMVNSADTPLYQAPKTLDGVGMHISHHVDFGPTMNVPMLVIHILERVIGRMLISIDTLSYEQRATVWRTILSATTGRQFVYVAEDHGGECC